MLRLLVVLFLMAGSILGSAQNPLIQFKVMAWNILHGGNDLEEGPDLEALSAHAYFAHFGEILLLNGKQISYPSDHGIVVTTFQLNP